MNSNQKTFLKDLLFDPSPKLNIEHDLYGFSSHVDLIKDYLEKCKSPRSISLCGSWGSGKTTLKNFIIEQIIKDKDSKIFPVDFNAWEYEQQTGILIPLISRLIKLGKLEPTKIKKVSSIITLAFMNLLLKTSTASMVDLSDLTDFEEYANENFFKYSKYVDNVEKTRGDFRLIIEEIIKQGKKQKNNIEKIVIFIDELDRCNPENTLRLLESIRNYFDVEGCIFMILVDDEILASYIDKKYENTKMDGHMYLEKIINTKFSIPEIKKIKLNSLCNNIMKSLEVSTDISFVSEIPRFYNPRKISKMFEKLNILSEKVDDLNDFKMSAELKAKSVEQRIHLAVLIILLYELYPKIYRDFHEWSEEYLSRVKTVVMSFFTDASPQKLADIKAIINYNSEEINLLGIYIFKNFKPSFIFFEVDGFLRELKII